MNQFPYRGKNKRVPDRSAMIPCGISVINMTKTIARSICVVRSALSPLPLKYNCFSVSRFLLPLTAMPLNLVPGCQAHLPISDSSCRCIIMSRRFQQSLSILFDLKVFPTFEEAKIMQTSLRIFKRSQTKSDSRQQGSTLKTKPEIQKANRKTRQL